MKKSAVAGVIDRKGGLRVVVTQRWRMFHHVGKREQLFVVPGFEVEEPVPWGMIPYVIFRVQKYVQEVLAPKNHCGGCNLCCKLPYIPALEKQSGAMCRNCVADWGCRIYHARPSVCRDFKCLWLKSQERNDRMPPELRPDKCGVYFEDNKDDPLIIEVHGKPNADAWRWINEMQALGYKAREITHYVGENR